MKKITIILAVVLFSFPCTHEKRCETTYEHRIKNLKTPPPFISVEVF